MMKPIVEQLLNKACESLILSIELFNRPSDTGRVSGTLILLDHGLEMLMKASIMERDGEIRKADDNKTISFKKAVELSLSKDDIRYLVKEQAMALNAINRLRDAVQHYTLEVSENHLYMLIQSGVATFDDILSTVFDKRLFDLIPQRVLPISTQPPLDIITLYDNEIFEIIKNVKENEKKLDEILPRYRSLAIVDSVFQGDDDPPSDENLKKNLEKLREGQSWMDIFKGVVTFGSKAEANNMYLSLRLSKKEGVPMQWAPNDSKNGNVVVIREVNEKDKYCFGPKRLAEKIEISVPKLNAVVYDLKLQEDIECYKVIKMDNSPFKRYSQLAKTKIEDAIKKEPIESIWERYKQDKKKIPKNN